MDSEKIRSISIYAITSVLATLKFDEANGDEIREDFLRNGFSEEDFQEALDLLNEEHLSSH